MNSLDVIRKAIIALDPLSTLPTMEDSGANCWNIRPTDKAITEAREAIADAEAYLKTGGWLDYPQYEPRSGQSVNGLVAAEPNGQPFVRELIYFGGGRYFQIPRMGRLRDCGYVLLKWQPLPPLPSDKPEELHGKDGV